MGFNSGFKGLKEAYLITACIEKFRFLSESQTDGDWWRNTQRVNTVVKLRPCTVEYVIISWVAALLSWRSK